MAGRITTLDAPGARLDHDHQAFSRLVLASPGMRTVSARKAQAGAAAAKAIAPVETGGYRDGITAEAVLRHGATGFDDGHHGRWVGVVSAGTDHALEVEFGNARQPRRRTLGNSMDTAAAG